MRLKKRRNISGFETGISFLLTLAVIDSNACALMLTSGERFLFGQRLDRIKAKTKESLLSEYNTASPSSSGAFTQDCDIVFIFPGAGGEDEFTTELATCIAKSDDLARLHGPRSRHIRVWDWFEHRGGIITAAMDGEAVGEAVAEAIAEAFINGDTNSMPSLTKVRSVHSIGISVGGFAGNAFSRRCKELHAPYVRLTLLDPFCSRGILGVGYGAKNFGREADYVEHFLNTDDPVPTTNDPLPLCAVIDVTNARERNEFIPSRGESMHVFPLVYYARHGYRSVSDHNGRIALPKHGENGAPERGSITVL